MQALEGAAVKRWFSERTWTEVLREHGWTALFAAITLVALRAEAADLTLTSFRDRAVSTATLLGVSVAARTSLFTTSIALFAATFALALPVLSWLGRAVVEGTRGILEALSIAGLCLWLARAYTVDVARSIELVLWLQAAVIVIGVLDRFVFRRGGHPERNAYVTTLGLIAAGLGFVINDFAGPEQDLTLAGPVTWIAPLMVALHLVVRATTWRREPERESAACVALLSGSAALAWLPTVSVLRDECYFVFNSRRMTSATPDRVEWALLFGLVLVALVLSVMRRREPASLEKSLWRAAFPVFVFGLVTYALYRPTMAPSDDLFEPANSGLLIQQWFDFHRVPFVDTFGAHGLSDSLPGFVYRWLHGQADETWQFYDFIELALGSVLVYQVVRRVSQNGYLAFFTAALLPFHIDLFPTYCRLALASLFVMEWLVAKPSLGRWIACAFYVAFGFAWRLDLGFANFVACAATVVVLRVVTTDFRPRWSHALLAGGLCGLVLGGGFWAIAHIRGVDPSARLADFARVLDSNQAFGWPEIARSIDPSVVWHLSIVPLLVLGVLAAVTWFERQRLSTRAPRFFLVSFLIFGAIYYFANYQRGIVRHSWRELGYVLVLSFGFALICSTLFLSWRTRPKTVASAFLGLASVLCGSFGLQGPLPEAAGRYASPWHLAEFRTRQTWHTRHSWTQIDRSPVHPEFEETHSGAFQAFAGSLLAPEQTFLDLTNSPMLYVWTHRLSPHYLNHQFLVYGEHLQRSAIAEFERHDMPFVLVRVEPDIAKRHDIFVNRHNTGDGAPNEVLRWLIHEWLYQRYEPWCVVQRWQVWRRLDWLAPAAPEGNESRVRASYAGSLPPDRRVVLTPEPANEASDADSGPPPKRVTYVCIEGNAPADSIVDLHCEFEGEDGSSEVARSLTLAGGDRRHYWTFPVERVPRELTRIQLDFSRATDFELRSVSVNDVPNADYAEIAERAQVFQAQWTGKLPGIWAAFDERPHEQLRTLRSLWPPTGIRMEARDAELFENGIHKEVAGFVLKRDNSRRALSAGDRIVFAAGGERVVERVVAHRVFVSGARLDPAADGPPNEARLVATDVAEPVMTARRFEFEPLLDAANPCYLALRLEMRHPQGKYALVTWGKDDEPRGSQRFEVIQPGEHEHLVRLSSAYSWARGDCNWIEINQVERPVKIHSVRLIAGD